MFTVVHVAGRRLWAKGHSFLGTPTLGRSRLGLFDVALVTTAVLMVATSQTVIFFHFIFVLMTLGAFSWHVTAFAWRATFWVSIVTADVAYAVVNGQTQVAELTEIPLLSTILFGVFLIASARAQAHDRLIEQDQAFLSNVLESIDDGVVAVDPEGTLIYANRAARKALPTLVQQTVPGATSQWPEVEVRRLMSAIASPPPGGASTSDADRELALVRANGEKWLLQATVRRMVSTPERQLGAVLVLRDVTSVRQAETQVQHSLDLLLSLQHVGQVLDSILDSEELGARLLKAAQGTPGLTAGMIHLCDEELRLRPWQSFGDDRVWASVEGSEAARHARTEAVERQASLPFRLAAAGEEEGELVGVILPLRARGHLIGILELYGSAVIGRSEALETLRSIAHQVAAALDNARLYQQLSEREQYLQHLVRSLLVFEENERRRIAYNIHDGLTQSAAALHMRLQTYADKHVPVLPEEREELRRIVGLVQQTVRAARTVIADLRPTALDDFGLASALRLHIEQLQAEGWTIQYDVDLGPKRLPEHIETALFRVALESMTNVRKHAQSLQVRLALRRVAGSVQLEVQDFGRGCELDAAMRVSGPGERIGISGMRERVALLDGDFAIESRPGQGTTVRASIRL